MMTTTGWRARRAVRRTGALALLACCALPAAALDLALPRGAEQSFRTVQDPGAYALPTGPWADGFLPTARVEGRIEVTAWTLPDTGGDAFQLALPLRSALTEAGFDILLDCKAQTCGGFDFRFATLVLPAPEMFVDLAEFHFVAARAPGGGAVSVLTSRDDRHGYIQIIRAGASPLERITATAEPVARATAAPGSLIGALERDGHVVLSDLVFRPGSTDLGSDRVESLDTLATYLAEHPRRQILFVGHTDATGTLEANRRVSLQRAEAALSYLRDRHGTPSEQIAAEGAGYLAPVASNLTPEGREANRRVEAVLVSTE